MKNYKMKFILLLQILLITVIFVVILRPIMLQLEDLTDAVNINTDRILSNGEKITSIEQGIINLSDTYGSCVLFVILENQDESIPEENNIIEDTDTNQDEDVIEYEYITEDIYSDDENYSDFYGRLYIPDINVDVALYYGWYQYITDRVDSANIYTWPNCNGETLADHDYQEFWKLFNADIGMIGYIKCKDGSVITMECTDIFDGHNIRSDVTDENGVSAYGRADYMMYTCRDGWQNVRIWLWKRIS